MTEGEQKLWNKARRVEVIPNFTTMHVSQFSNYTTKRIIAVGRIEWEKGYSRLIKIWEIVYSRHPDWRLDIYGEGSLKKTIETIINSNSIKNLKIHQFTHNISQEFANSSICVVTSYYESFSLVLLEAMKHGVPCVAFDCPFGPGSIIQDGYNGFLSENGDCNLFAERLCNLIEDTKLREYFSGTSIRHAKLYDVKGIIDKWDTLFKSIL